jgi:hypothetical protein
MRFFPLACFPVSRKDSITGWWHKDACRSSSWPPIHQESDTPQLGQHDESTRSFQRGGLPHIWLRIRSEKGVLKEERSALSLGFPSFYLAASDKIPGKLFFFPLHMNFIGLPWGGLYAILILLGISFSDKRKLLGGLLVRAAGFDPITS